MEKLEVLDKSLEDEGVAELVVQKKKVNLNLNVSGVENAGPKKRIIKKIIKKKNADGTDGPSVVAEVKTVIVGGDG